MNHQSLQPARPNPAACSLFNMLAYGVGECASSLVMNSVFAFWMMYHTKALKLDPSWAGIAMAIAVFCETVTRAGNGLHQR